VLPALESAKTTMPLSSVTGSSPYLPDVPGLTVPALPGHQCRGHVGCQRHGAGEHEPGKRHGCLLVGLRRAVGGLAVAQLAWRQGCAGCQRRHRRLREPSRARRRPWCPCARRSSRPPRPSRHRPARCADTGSRHRPERCQRGRLHGRASGVGQAQRCARDRDGGRAASGRDLQHLGPAVRAGGVDHDLGSRGEPGSERHSQHRGALRVGGAAGRRGRRAELPQARVLAAVAEPC